MSNIKIMEQLEDEVAEYHDAFTMFDMNENGTISTEDFSTVVRSMGYTPTEAELRDLIEKMDPTNTKTINYKTFCKYVAKMKKDKNNKKQLRKAFRFFDTKGTGYLAAAEFRHILTTLGETMTKEEVNKMIHQMGIVRNGKVKYEEFISIITSK